MLWQLAVTQACVHASLVPASVAAVTASGSWSTTDTRSSSVQLSTNLPMSSAAQSCGVITSTLRRVKSQVVVSLGYVFDWHHAALCWAAGFSASSPDEDVVRGHGGVSVWGALCVHTRPTPAACFCFTLGCQCSRNWGRGGKSPTAWSPPLRLDAEPAHNLPALLCLM